MTHHLIKNEIGKFQPVSYIGKVKNKGILGYHDKSGVSRG